MLIALLTLLAALPSAASSLSMSAEADPRSALPGVPVRLIVTVENKSDVRQTLPERMVIQVRPENGEPFIPEVFDQPVKMLPEEYLEARTLKPAEKRIYDIPLATELTAGAMADSRLWAPGIYGLRLYFHDDLQSDPVSYFGLDGLLAAGRIRSPLLVSSEATLHVEQPTGVDAEVWATILKKTEGRGLLINGLTKSDPLARELFARDSAYMPYLIDYMKSTPHDQFEAIWSRIIKYDPDHPVVESVRLARARTKAYEAENSISKGANLQTILAQTDEARSELEALQKDARQDLVRIRSRNALAKVKSRERLVEMHREMASKR